MHGNKAFYYTSSSPGDLQKCYPTSTPKDPTSTCNQWRLAPLVSCNTRNENSNGHGDCSIFIELYFSSNIWVVIYKHLFFFSNLYFLAHILEESSCDICNCQMPGSLHYCGKLNLYLSISVSISIPTSVSISISIATSICIYVCIYTLYFS